MNIFWLDKNIKTNASYYCDKHIVKMLLEYAQMLSTANRTCGLDEGYKIAHLNHPCTVWVRTSSTNWKTLYLLAYYVQVEYYNRYGKVHKSWRVIRRLSVPNLPSKGLTTVPQCMPEEYKNEDLITAYRNYYKGEKRGIARWNYSEEPHWWRE